MVTFSVIIPAYNVEKTLGPCIQSVLDQTCQDFELIVVDDGSKDRSAEVAESFGPRVTCIRQENRGSGAARNAAIQASRGQYVAMLDADDLWLPTKLERQLESIRQHPNAGFFYTGHIRIEHNGTERLQRRKLSTLPCGKIFAAMFAMNCASTSSVVIPRAVLDRVGLFNPEYKNAQDWELWLRVVHDYEAWALREALMKFREVPGSLSENRERLHATVLRIIEDLRKRYENHPPHVTPKMYRDKVVDTHLKFARGLVKRKQPERAREFVSKAFALKPWSPRVWREFVRTLA